MRVLVAGSFRSIPPDDPEGQRDLLTEAGRELGRQLAAAGHALLVGSEDPQDVDPFVVEGYLAAGGKHRVQVHLTRDAAECYATEAAAGKVQNEWHRYPDWDVTVLEVLRAPDVAVIVVGGRQGVVQTGVAGWMLGRPVVPIASFDGGSRTVWDYSSSNRKEFYFGALGDSDIDRLRGPWGKTAEAGTAKWVVDVVGRLAAAKGLSETPPALVLAAGGGMFAFLAAWVLLVSAPLMGWSGRLASVVPAVKVPGLTHGAGVGAVQAGADHSCTAGQSFILLVLGVCSAGALGSFIQTLRRVREGHATRWKRLAIDLLLGIAAGFLTAALYLLAQIALTGALVLPETPDDYVRAALVMGVGALFASLYLDAAFSRFDGAKDSVLTGEFGKKPPAA